MLEFGGFDRACKVGLCAQLAGAEEWPFQVRPQQPGRARPADLGRSAHGHQGLRDLVGRRRHGGGQPAGGAVAGVGAGDGLHGVATLHHVRPAATVQVQVDEAGQDARRVVSVRVGGLAHHLGDAGRVVQRAQHPTLGREHVAVQGLAHGVRAVRTSCSAPQDESNSGARARACKGAGR